MTENFLQMGTVTYDGKDYCLKEWAMNVMLIHKPNDITVNQTIVDNSENTDHAVMLSEALGGVEILSKPRKSGMKVRQSLVECYTELFIRAGNAPLFLLEADVMPPPNALRELWNFHTENSDVGVIGCLVGYPRVTGDDGTEGNYKWMVGRYLKEGEQQYELINALDAELYDRIRPKLQQWTLPRKNSGRAELRVANMEGRIWYQGFSPKKADRALRKAMGEIKMPMKVHKRELYPDNLPVPPNFKEPAQVEALQWCCTLIMPEVHQKIRPRLEGPGEENKNYAPDYYFWKDCIKAGIKVFSVPVVCRHRSQNWPPEIMSNL
jgi:hypothetical protein